MVLFFSPTCPHCHTVIQQHLPTIFARYGGAPAIRFDESLPENRRVAYEIANGTLQLLLIDVSVPEGGTLYRAWAEANEVPQENWGVPRLVIADTSLVGSRDIPELLSPMIEQGLAAGGIDWPEIVGFEAALATIPGAEPLADAGEVTETPAPGAEPTPEAEPAAEGAAPEGEAGPADAAGGDGVSESTEGAGSATGLSSLPTRSLTMAERFQQDRVGNSFSVLVLVGMLVSLIGVALWVWRTGAGGRIGIALPIVAVVGALVAAYLTYVETSGATAVCGPVGDCNTVNQSQYAMLFGRIPVGLVGLIGYLLIILLWIVHRLRVGSASDWTALGILGMSVFGTLFSIYLTFLEPFVIGATCAWCLTSAVAVTLLMWLSARPGRSAWLRLTRTG
jgi:uncharacterized membrane protein